MFFRTFLKEQDDSKKIGLCLFWSAYSAARRNARMHAKTQHKFSLMRTFDMITVQKKTSNQQYAFD